MKIGLVTGEYPPMQGGVGAFTRELATALAAAGHAVHIITDRKARPSEERRSLWDLREPYDIGFAQLHPRVGRWWWSAVSAVADISSRYELDVVNVQYQAAAYDMYVPAINFLPWRLQALSKTVVTFHDLRVPYLFPKSGRLRSWVVSRLAHTADGVIATNETDLLTLREMGIGDSQLRRIPIGSNIMATIPAAGEIDALRRKLGLRESDCLLGYFGFLNESKGADTLIRAMSELDEGTQLAFIGGLTGSSDRASNEAFLARMKQLIDDLGLSGRVHWSGFLDDSGISTYMNAADVMVMPYRDGASLRRGTLMAVLAHGRPLITTEPKRLVPELVHRQNVWLTPVDDAAALKEAILALMAAPELRARLGDGAKQLSRLFTWDKIAEQTASFFRELLADGELGKTGRVPGS